MKITKSELFNLIKEEIMSEMDGLTMMDDPYDDSQEPESFKNMDQVAEMMENAVLTSMDDLISIVSNFLVTTQGGHETPTELMMEGMRMLHQAGFREPDASVVEKMIKDEMDSGDYDTTYYADGEGVAPMPTDDQHIREGMENITPENMQLVMDAMRKMAPLVGVISLPVLIGLVYEQFRKMGAK